MAQIANYVFKMDENASVINTSVQKEPRTVSPTTQTFAEKARKVADEIRKEKEDMDQEETG